MHFTLKQLRYVEAAGRTGSIARAADEMNISQSSITAAIDALETQLDFDLFMRMPAKGIHPTPQGHEVLALIRRHLEEVRVLESELSALAGDPVGTLRLACYDTTAPYVLPPLLKEFARRYAGVRISVQEGNMDEIRQFLTEGSADLALTYRRAMPDSQGFVGLFRARPYALLPAEHALARRRSVSLKALCQLPMIMLDLPHAREYYLSLFSDAGLSPLVAHTTKTAPMARALVAGGFGFTILNIRDPGNVEPVSGYAARPIRDTVEAPFFGIAQQPGRRRPQIIDRFIALAQELAEQGRFRELTLFP